MTFYNFGVFLGKVFTEVELLRCIPNDSNDLSRPRVASCILRIVILATMTMTHKVCVKGGKKYSKKKAVAGL